MGQGLKRCLTAERGNQVNGSTRPLAAQNGTDERELIPTGLALLQLIRRTRAIHDVSILGQLRLIFLLALFVGLI